jgi:hypothetical protein
MNTKRKILKFSALLVAFFVLSTSASCGIGPDPGSATITIHNNSDYDVTNLLVAWEGGPVRIFSEEFKSGDHFSFKAEFAPSRDRHGNYINFRVAIEYIVNGQQFMDVNEIGGITHESGGHFSLREIRNGSHLHIHITNEGYKLSGGEPSRLSRP